MLERMIVKHWIALTVGFTLLGVLIRVRYNTQGHFAIGGEWLAPAFLYCFKCSLARSANSP